MSINIRTADHTDAARWDAFVAETASSTFFHRFGWKTVLEEAFGHRTHYLVAEENERITGILPLAEIRSLLFGHHLISTPFCVYGGVIATSSEADEALVRHACELANDLRVDDLELRNRVLSDHGWPGSTLYVTFRKSISADEETNLNAIPRKQRAMVRKGIQAGLQSEQVTDVDRFYRIYAESVRNLGTPVFPRKYFRVLQRVFREDAEVAVITHGSADVAAVMSFYFRDEVLPYYGGSIQQAREVKANDFMYWDLMRRAGSLGTTIFDYGRSKVGTGAYSFKKNWGFEPTPLHYEYFLVRAKEMPKINPTNPKYGRFVGLWQRLPLPVANVLGPPLARYLG